jgi:manganese transport protein
MIEFQRGDILKADADALVNTVNCVGIMGRGIALQFRKEYPENFSAYEAACHRGDVRPGTMFVVKLNRLQGPRFIINFPTKRHWKGRSRIEDIRSGLEALTQEIQRLGIRKMEGVILALVATIGACYVLEVVLARPVWGEVAAGFVPRISSTEALYVAIGILGATVMPHNLYLHSSIVQTRRYELNPAGKREAIKFATIDSTVALMFALFINAAILIVAAATFYTRGHNDVAEIQDAYQLLSPLLGVTGASTLFALALLASGQNSTLTGTLAGQIVMEGFLNIRLRPWLRRLVTRAIAIVPAIIVISISGQKGTTNLLVLSQVVLSLQLSFAVFPLVLFTGDRLKMGEFVNGPIMKSLAWLVAIAIAALNAWLLTQTFRGWFAI